ncbi:rab GTPase-binding effector protein 1-like [Clytia hemisphaerica]|uniref:Rabaptin coiled-coil domain-containing protein n=1 Tax=Clytia hemisphaerica TaxID=252671 RepID=A0A7M5XC03_9CNID|eukprot:TCONS_00056319-protein
MATAVTADEYKTKYEALVLEKNQMERDFGQKRAQFRQLYLDVEGKLKNEKEVVKQLEIQTKDLTKKNEDLKSENEGIRIAAQLSSEEQSQSMINSHQEEIASLQHIYQEHAKENQARLANQYEDERNKLIETIKQLENKLKNNDNKTLDSTIASLVENQEQQSLMSSLSNTFIKKVSSAGPPPKLKQDGTTTTKDQSLDVSQQLVQKDVDAWKSILAPLELEIQSLKSQLEEAKKNTQTTTITEQEMQEMKKVVDSERSARTDLEMYVAVLNTQKGVLQEDTDKLKRELHNVCRLFEQEKMSHGELKQTWKLANEQFLDQQTKLSFELDYTKKLLTPQQLEQVSKEVRQFKASQPSAQQTPKLNTTPKTKSRNELLGDFDPLGKKSNSKETLAQKASRSPATKKSDIKQPSMGESFFNALFPAASQAKQFNEYMQDMATTEKPLVLSSSSDSDSEDDLNRAIRAQNKQRYQQHHVVVDETGQEVIEDDKATPPRPQPLTPPPQSTTDVVDVADGGLLDENKKPLKKSNSSGDILSPTRQMLSADNSLHEKSLSQGDVSFNSTNRSLLTDEVDSKLSLNETGWSTMSSDNYYNNTCMMCQNYEKQLQLVQKDLLDVKHNETLLVTNLKTLQSDLDSEKEKFSSLERSIESVDVDTKSQINIYKTNQQEVDKQVTLLHSQFKRFQDDIVKEIKAMSEERDRALAEVAQNQNTSGEELSFEREEELKTEIMFLKDRMMAEQVDKEAIESVLQGDLKDARDQIVYLQQEVQTLRNGGNPHSRQQQQQQAARSQDEDPPLLTL